MSEPNPYQPPAAGSDNLLPEPSGPIPHTIVEAMRQTRPWAMTVGILGFMGAGLFGLVSINLLSRFQQHDSLPNSIGLFYLVLALFLIPPSLLLCRYSIGIKRFLQHTNLDTLGDALCRQKSFWRLFGILAIALPAMLFMLALWQYLAPLPGSRR